MNWSTACPDWEQRLLKNESLLPFDPMFPEAANAALSVFMSLRLVDVAGRPTIGEVCRPWVFDIARAVFGTCDPETGRRLVRHFFLLVSKKNSKALALDTPVATPFGFTTIAEVAVGDSVFDVDGNICKVISKSPIFKDHDCYEVEFSTGEKVVCDAEHLWVTDAHKERQRQRGDRKVPFPRAKTTKEIAASLKVPSGVYSINNHRTSLCAALNLPEQEYTIPPYVLGLWLGNGTAAAATITMNIVDDEHAISQIIMAGQNVKVRYYENKPGSVTLALSEESRSPFTYHFLTEARKLSLINNKHIPQIYLRGSVEQRLALLRGLIDSDGSVSKKGQVCYYTKSVALRDGIIELINSLGYKASWSESRAMLNGIDYGPAYLVQFWPFDSVDVCTTPRKLARQRARTNRNSPRSTTRQIVDVRRVESVPTQCIEIDSPTKQFLITKSLIPTHNSSTAAAIMLTALIRNWRDSAEFIILAPTIEVANNSFIPARDMVYADPELSVLFHVKENFRLIQHRLTKATLKVVTADSTVVGGKKAVGVLIDELWQFGSKADADNMLREATGGLASRPEGFVIYLSTQSDKPPAGVFKTKLAEFRAIRDGEIVDPRSLPLIYEYPKQIIDSGAYLDPTNFYITNPNLGASVDAEFLIDQLAKAQRAGDAELCSFAAKHLNIEIGQSLNDANWRGIAEWSQAADDSMSLEDIIERSEVMVAGIDGGGLDDLLALGLLGRERGTDRWLYWMHCWVHRKSLQKHLQESPRFNDFAKDSDLTIVDDIAIACSDLANRVAVVDRSRKLATKEAVGVDSAGIGIVVDELVAAGIDESRIWSVAQGRNLNGAIKTVEVGLNNGKLVHCDQPLMNWAVGNCKVEPSGNAVIITKAKSGAGKIDPVMALLDCVVLMQKHPAAARKASVYSTMSDDVAEKIGAKRAREKTKSAQDRYFEQFESMELYQ